MTAPLATLRSKLIAGAILGAVLGVFRSISSDVQLPRVPMIVATTVGGAMLLSARHILRDFAARGSDENTISWIVSSVPAWFLATIVLSPGEPLWFYPVAAVIGGVVGGVGYAIFFSVAKTDD